MRNQDVYLLQDDSPEYSLYDLARQALHMAAAAACRGSTLTGGSSPNVNTVLSRNNREPESCTQLCAKTYAHNCDAEVSVYGNLGKATENRQIVGFSYNYICDSDAHCWGEGMGFTEGAFSFCCCRR